MATHYPNEVHLMTFTRSRLRDILTNSTCSAEPNDLDVPDGAFWHSDTWEAHHIGWAISGGCTVLTCLISFYGIWSHARSYRKPLEQRQIIRCLLLAPVFSILSCVGYRFVRHYIYFILIRDMYEAFCIGAFLALILMFLADTPATERQLNAEHNRRRLAFPLCCWRFKPWKPSFVFAVKWIVLQFVVVKPVISLAGVITEFFGKYCRGSYSFKFAAPYYQTLDFISVGVAIYGLVLLYGCVKEDLAGKRPLSKFLTIKIIVALVFYQDFIFSGLVDGGVIRATRYWTTTNISDALSALTTTVEMVLIALFGLYAFPASEYKALDPDDKRHTSFWRALAHSQNYADFALDVYFTSVFLFDTLRGKKYTQSNEALRVEQALYVGAGGNHFGFEEAFQPLHRDSAQHSEAGSVRSGKRKGAGGEAPTPAEIEEGAPPDWLDQSDENSRLLGSGRGTPRSGAASVRSASYGTINQEEAEEAERRRLQALSMHGGAFADG